MIISPGRRYIFVHIPKTGGTSMALALESRAMKDDIMLGDTPKAKNRRHRVKDAHSRGRLWKHSSLADIDGLLSTDAIMGFFTFTLVRNPWDRMVSYYHWLQTQRFDHPSVAMAKTMDFTAFVVDERTQSQFCANPARSYMETADKVEKCDAYIRIESFELDAQPLFTHLGFTLTLPHENRAARDAPYQSYYSQKTADCVADYCSADIAQFGYRFE
jgi:hypothetical protein